jgi:hypothetical protein
VTSLFRDSKEAIDRFGMPAGDCLAFHRCSADGGKGKWRLRRHLRNWDPFFVVHLGELWCLVLWGERAVDYKHVVTCETVSVWGRLANIPGEGAISASDTVSTSPDTAALQMST